MPPTNTVVPLSAPLHALQAQQSPPSFSLERTPAAIPTPLMEAMVSPAFAAAPSPMSRPLALGVGSLEGFSLEDVPQRKSLSESLVDAVVNHMEHLFSTANLKIDRQMQALLDRDPTHKGWVSINQLLPMSGAPVYHTQNDNKVQVPVPPLEYFSRDVQFIAYALRQSKALLCSRDGTLVRRKKTFVTPLMQSLRKTVRIWGLDLPLKPNDALLTLQALLKKCDDADQDECLSKHIEKVEILEPRVALVTFLKPKFAVNSLSSAKEAKKTWRT
ncbi:MAG: hypothetical protein MHM6MM_000936 [Cercozoa sp. M6MM]